MLNASSSKQVKEVEDDSVADRRAKEEYLRGRAYNMTPDSNVLPYQAHSHQATGQKESAPEGSLKQPETQEEGYSIKSGDQPELPPPLKESSMFKVLKRKRTAPGLAAIGASVLSMQGKLGSITERTIDLRLDSGADVSLVSKEFLESLKHKVPISKGVKMRLWQLTDKNACLEGYVTLPVFVESEDRTVVETEVKAYVVPGMSVDILLGEDYQLAHELMIARDIEKGTRISYRSCPYSITALPVGRTNDFDRMTPSHVSHASYVRVKQHR